MLVNRETDEMFQCPAIVPREIGVDPEYQPSYIEDKLDPCKDERDRTLRWLR